MGWYDPTPRQVEVDCRGLPSTCCPDACGPLEVWTGKWDIVGAGPDHPGPSLCESQHWTRMTGMNCYACCVKQNTLSNTISGKVVAGGGFIIRPVVPFHPPLGNLKYGRWWRPNLWGPAGTWNPYRVFLTRDAGWGGARWGQGNAPRLHRFIKVGGRCGSYAVIAVGFHDIFTMAFWCSSQCAKPPRGRRNMPQMGLLHGW
jgi:hypothetical protein